MNKENVNIHLRPASLDDTDLILKWRNNEELKKYFIIQKDIVREEHEAWFRSKVMTGEVFQFIIINTDTNQPIGSTNIQNIDKVNKNAEFGIFLEPNGSIGKGIGVKAVEATLQYAFESLKLHKVYLRVLANNPRAIRCYEKAGFIRDGLFKDELIMNGEYIDLVHMSVMNKKI